MPDQILSVTAYTRRMNDGFTQPFLCTCDDGKQYIVKSRPKLRSSELAAEWMCASLAGALGLSIPDYCIVDVGEEIIEFMPDLQGQIYPGLAFATVYIEGTSTINLQQARNSVNISDQKKIFFFDKWILNTDRSLTEFGGNVNIIFDSVNNRHYLIDHNLAFDQSATEEEYDVHVYSPSRRMWRYDLVDYDELQVLATHALRNIDDIIEGIPRSWLADNLEQNYDFFLSIKSRLEKCQDHEFWSNII
ncbi:hypothetical protein FVB43_10090 [Erwinia rhapontici]|uniref:HipA family kinase n=1 Tax=Erwinia rhapontici TaxID=55212 RepID=UPI0014382B1D|nr:HipA family kinase [Erwinia rhapontici]NKG30392.1 hypothetical protein [Erwinia rhapontici]